MEGRRQQSGAFSSLVLNGKHEADLAKLFFFRDEKVVMKGKFDEDKAGERLCYLQGEAFDYFYETYSQNDGLNKVARDHQTVEKALLDHFESVPKPKGNIWLPVAVGWTATTCSRL